jgi:alpha-beta hydrolase superfamily lysophospholipase
MKMISSLILTILSIVTVLSLLIYFFQDKLIFFPQKLEASFKFRFRDNFRERYFETSKNVRIHALHFQVKNPNGLIYYLHGNAGSLQGWGEVAGDFTVHGYDVLMIDYRGYGKSNGTITESGLLKDAIVIYDTMRKEYNEKSIVVYGRSIGTGIASYVASERSPGMLILESPYYNLPDAAKSYFPWVPSSLIRFKFRNDLHLKKITCPVILFHGTLDEVLDVKGSYKLKPLLKPDDRLIIIEGGRHNDLSFFEEYQTELKKILQISSRQ